MRYEINVALGDRHYFATAKRSIMSPDVLEKIFLDFVTRFPASEGFRVSVSWDDVTSQHFTAEKFLARLKRKQRKTK